MIDLSQTSSQAAPQSSARSRVSLGKVALTSVSVLTYLFLYVPIIILVLYSFTTDAFGARLTGFTFSWYEQLWRDQRLMGATFNTLYVAFVSMIFSTIIGTMTALALERFRFRGRAAYDAFLYLPVVIPEIVMALSLLAFFSFAFSLIRQLTGIQLRNGLATVIISHIAFSISFVVIVVRASLRGFDQRMEEAAHDLGANGWQTFWRITFPLILPGIIGGGLLAFTISLDDFIISFFTTGPGTSLLPVEVYSQVKRAVTPKINAISTLMLAVSMTLVVLSQIVQRPRT
jgi:spermidine/putrescine transport system permease protein